jgi:signal peptidase II
LELAGEGDRDEVGLSRIASARLVLFIGIAIVGCAADLLTKQLAFERIGEPGGDVWWIFDGYFGFETSVNHGALFGMGQGMVPLFAAVSFLAIGAIGFWVLRGGGLRDLMLTVALGMILGGILGNLYDRLGFWGHSGVRDWILFRYKTFTWPNFNIADSLLVCGAGLLMWHSWRVEHVKGDGPDLADGRQ